MLDTILELRRSFFTVYNYLLWLKFELNKAYHEKTFVSKDKIFSCIEKFTYVCVHPLKDEYIPS